MDYSLWGHNKLDTIEHTYTQRHALLKKKSFGFISNVMDGKSLECLE